MNIDKQNDLFLASLIKEVKNNWWKKTALLAKAAGISQGNLSKILNSKTTPPYETQVKIADACRYEYEDFLKLAAPTTTPEPPKDPILEKLKDGYTKHIIEQLIEIKENHPSEFGKICVEIDETLKKARSTGKAPLETPAPGQGENDALEKKIGGG